MRDKWNDRPKVDPNGDVPSQSPIAIGLIALLVICLIIAVIDQETGSFWQFIGWTE